MNAEELKTKRYSELQALAKKAGIKANMKAEKLIQALLAANSCNNDAKVNGNGDSSEKENEPEVLKSADEQNVLAGLGSSIADTERIKQDTPKKSSAKKRGTYELKSPKCGTPKGNPSAQHKVDFSAVTFQPSNTPKSKCNEKDLNDNKKLKLATKVNCHVSSYRKIENRKATSKIPKVKNSAISKVKTPNFARIHQKNFEKMESLSEYVAKKNKLMNSAKKTPYASRCGSTAVTPSISKVSVGLKSPFRHNATNSIQKAALPSKPAVFSKLKTPKISARDALKPFNVGASTVEKTITKSIRPKAKDVGKKKINGKTVDSNCCAIRNKQRQYMFGVRTNRRFELQMKARLKSETA